MAPLTFHAIPTPHILASDVKSIRIITVTSKKDFTIHTTPDGVSGIVFHLNAGRSALTHIITQSGRTSHPSPLFLYGPGIEPAMMHYKQGTSTTIQITFEPQALYTLLGLNAQHLANNWTHLHDFCPEDLETHMLNAINEQQQLNFLINFLIAKAKQVKPKDPLIAESLHLIHTNVGTLHVKDLLALLHISERQFERRFTQTIGLTPQTYIRIKRFHEAARLIKTQQFTRLIDIACALNFSDQSHFIRDIKAFSGLTPKTLLSHHLITHQS